MHGETISRSVNQLDGLLLRCFVHALPTTLSFMRITSYMEEDAKCVSLLHEDFHGIPGMLHSLDYMHVH